MDAYIDRLIISHATALFPDAASNTFAEEFAACAKDWYFLPLGILYFSEFDLDKDICEYGKVFLMSSFEISAAVRVANWVFAVVRKPTDEQLYLVAFHNTKHYIFGTLNVSVPDLLVSLVMHSAVYISALHPDLLLDLPPRRMILSRYDDLRDDEELKKAHAAGFKLVSVTTQQ